MIIGYARTSTIEQEAGLEAQLRDLKAAGCERTYQEQVSSVAERPELDKVLTIARDGDVVVVTKLDRLARNVQDMWAIIKRIEAQGAAIKILNLNLDTSTETGKLMLTIMGGVAQFERGMMLERQREGIAKARADGKYKGRKPLADDVKAKIIELAGQDRGATYIARQLKLGRSSVYRVLEENRI